MEIAYKKVFDPIAEGNPAPIVNPNGAVMDCLECGRKVDSADGLCTDCWYWRHDARIDDGAPALITSKEGPHGK